MSFQHFDPNSSTDMKTQDSLLTKPPRLSDPSSLLRRPLAARMLSFSPSASLRKPTLSIPLPVSASPAIRSIAGSPRPLATSVIKPLKQRHSAARPWIPLELQRLFDSVELLLSLRLFARISQEELYPAGPVGTAWAERGEGSGTLAKPLAVKHK